MNRLLINSTPANLEQSARFCLSEKIGLEISDFAFPKSPDVDEVESTAKQAAAASGMPLVGCHGPFLDLIGTSRDPAIVEISRKRHQAALAATHQVGACYYIAHVNYNALIRNPPYRKNFAQRSADFWRPLADWAGARNITISLENLWEPAPEIQEEILAVAKHEFLKASLDNGHALIFSEFPAAHWIEKLGKNLFHCHLHDNSGTQDEHKPVGEGKEDWTALIAALRKWAPDALLVAESDELDLNRKSLTKLRALLSAYSAKDRTDS